MLKDRSLRKAVAMLCVLCMLLSLFANGAIALAPDDGVATEEVSAGETGDADANGEALYAQQPDSAREGGDASDDTQGIPDSIAYNEEPIHGDASQSGVAIRVSAPSGSFPDGTTVQINTATNEDSRVGFDVAFIDATGAKVQPANGSGVSVSFSISTDSSLFSNDGSDTRISVYHKTDDGTVEELESIDAKEAPVQLEITAFHFSEYGVVGMPIPASEAEKAAGLQTRAARSATSDYLADFLTDVIINAPTDENGNYIINPNSTYEMILKFSESEGLQFDDEGVLVYNFPEGVIINDVGATAFSITVVDENGTAIVYDNIFEVVDGQLRIQFNQDDPNFERLKAMPNVSFSIAFSSSFDETAGEIVFNESIVKDFVYEETADLGIQKALYMIKTATPLFMSFGSAPMA